MNTHRFNVGLLSPFSSIYNHRRFDRCWQCLSSVTWSCFLLLYYHPPGKCWLAVVEARKKKEKLFDGLSKLADRWCPFLTDFCLPVPGARCALPNSKLLACRTSIWIAHKQCFSGYYLSFWTIFFILHASLSFSFWESMILIVNHLLKN